MEADPGTGVRREIQAGDPVYLYEKDADPIGTVHAVSGADLLLDLAGGGECQLPLEVVESAVRHRVLLAAHRLDKAARDSIERARESRAARRAAPR